MKVLLLFEVFVIQVVDTYVHCTGQGQGHAQSFELQGRVGQVDDTVMYV